MEGNKQIQIKDESSDKNYFTIIPNYVLNHSTAVAQALYSQLKRLAGESGVAYPSSRYLMKQLDICRNTLKKEFQYLLEKKWIKYVGEKEINTDGGKQRVKSYKIVNLWDINNDFYRGGVKKRHTFNKRGVKKVIKGVSSRGVKIDDKEELVEEEPLEEEHGLAKPTRANNSFPKNDYNEVCEAYKKIRQIEPQGFEWQPIQQSIKFMFMSKRSVEDIIGCMKWLAKSDEEWTENWTINTVKLKIAFYLSSNKKAPSVGKY